ncbi:MAG: amidohydrolase family protein [Lachnospiraceae bacterium]|nr:amidohydrolase family protein [Lachnospiraceae bacterium]
MLAIIHADLIMPDHIIPDGFVLIENGVIKDFGDMEKIGKVDGYEILDAKGAFVGPGFIDIHTHAGGAHSFYGTPEDASEAVKHLLRHGITTVLPTMAYSLDKETLLDKIRIVQALMKKPEGANIGGLYLEGPYLNPKFGACKDDIVWHSGAKREDYEEVIEQAGNDVRVWAVAPEREGIEQFIKDAKAANSNLRFAVAHSEATPQQIEALMPYGLCIGTHHTNATGTIVKYSECRGVCVDEAVNYNHDIYAELICDKKGIHVDPYMLRLIRRIKGDDRIILISDSTVRNGPVPGPEYKGADDINFDFAGEISGTKLTLNAACYNMMKHTGASIVDVFNYASRNPARAVGFLDRGEIRKGLRADLVLIDYKINVQKVILKGVVQ